MLYPFDHDLWQPRGLGSTSWEVYTALLRIREAATVSRVVKETGCSPATVRKALKRLEVHGLTFREGGILWGAQEVNEAYLDDVAKRIGTYGKGDHKKAKHKRERDSYVAWRLRSRGRKKN